MKNCPIRESCPDEDTAKCLTCNPTAKSEPVKVGLNEAIEYFSEENETYEHMMGESAKMCIEYRVNQIAIEAMKEQLKSNTNN